MNTTLFAVLSSFREINRSIRQIFRTCAEEAGLTAIQLWILEVLSTNHNMSVTDLAEHLQMTNGPVSTSVEQLVQLGLVDRDRSGADRRIVEINLTESGVSKVLSLFNPDSELLNRLSRILEISSEDIQVLLEIHKKVFGKLASKGV